MSQTIKLHLGCGNVYLKNWVNIDLDSPVADEKIDLTKELPFTNESIDFIYSEHFIEHIHVAQAVALFTECNRILKSGGVMRIATPDLDTLIFRYLFGWKKQKWIKKYGYEWLQTKAEMLNLCFHEWGHQYLYNFEELQRRVLEGGFMNVARVNFSKSQFDELENLESREDSKLIIEATK